MKPSKSFSISELLSAINFLPKYSTSQSPQESSSICPENLSSKIVQKTYRLDDYKSEPNALHVRCSLIIAIIHERSPGKRNIQNQLPTIFDQSMLILLLILRIFLPTQSPWTERSIMNDQRLDKFPQLRLRPRTLPDILSSCSSNPRSVIISVDAE